MLLELLRVRQYYKNLVIFLPLLFVGSLFETDKFLLVLFGFVCLCLVSSANYIINDIFDLKSDRAHPEKRVRPIASGRIGILSSFAIAVLLLFAALIFSYFISQQFLYIIIALFALTSSYTAFFKHEIFADLCLIAVNFVLRGVSGAWLINASVSPWLVLCLFFLALFMAVGKRDAELESGNTEESSLVNNLVNKSKKVYTKEITALMMSISTSMLVLSYSLYSFLSIYPKLLVSLPFAIYVIFRYLWLIENCPFIARHPEYFIRDGRLVAGIMLWILVVIFVIYI